MNTTAEGREAVETALEGFCDSLPSSLYEESSHVKVYFSLNAGFQYVMTLVLHCYFVNGYQTLAPVCQHLKLHQPTPPRKWTHSSVLKSLNWPARPFILKMKYQSFLVGMSRLRWKTRQKVLK